MFELGECIVYGINGVCKVMEIGTLDVKGISKDKLYYTLIPIYSNGSKFFTPIDNEKVVMRPVISRKDADALIDDFKDIETIPVADDTRIEDVYKKLIRKCDSLELAKMIKTIYQRKQLRVSEGKKITVNEEKYLKMAEDSLYGELAIPLEMEKDAIHEFIIDKLEL